MRKNFVNSSVSVWAVAKFERSDNSLFYQSPLYEYDTNDKMRSLWEFLRLKYCILCKYDNISDQYRLGLPVPRNLVIANIILLGKLILKEVSKWLKELF